MGAAQTTCCAVKDKEAQSPGVEAAAVVQSDDLQGACSSADAAQTSDATGDKEPATQEQPSDATGDKEATAQEPSDQQQAAAEEKHVAIEEKVDAVIFNKDELPEWIKAGSADAEGFCREGAEVWGAGSPAMSREATPKLKLNSDDHALPATEVAETADGGGQTTEEAAPEVEPDTPQRRSSDKEVKSDSKKKAAGDKDISAKKKAKAEKEAKEAAKKKAAEEKKKAAEEAKKKAEEDRKNEDELRKDAESGDAEAVCRLLRAKVNVNAEDEGVRTALHFAAQEGHEEVVDVLIHAEGQTVKLDIQTEAQKNTALHLATKFSMKGIAHKLVCAGASLKVKNKQGKTAVDLAKGDLATWLKEKNPAKVNPPWAKE